MTVLATALMLAGVTWMGVLCALVRPGAGVPDRRRRRSTWQEVWGGQA